MFEKYRCFGKMKILKSASPELIIFLNENASKYEYGIDSYYSIYFGLSE